MDLATSNNQTFVWSLNVAAWATIYDLTTARFEMQIRKTATDPTVIIGFDSDTDGAAKGTIVFDPTSNIITVRGAAADIASLEAGTYVYDLRMTVPVPSPDDPLKKLFTYGDIVFESGVTR